MFRTLLLLLSLTFVGTVLDAQAVDFEFRAPNEILFYDEPTGVGHGVYPFFIAENPTPGFPHGITAFSMSIVHDNLYLEPTEIILGPQMQALNGGTGPILFTPNLSPINGPGLTIGIIYDFIGTEECFYSVPVAPISVRYDTNAIALAGNAAGLSTPITWGALGSPPIENAIFEGGAQKDASTVDGALELVPVTGFLRGDANRDESLTPILEGVAILDHLFNGLVTDCRDAMDANDDGAVNVLDAVHMFVWGFANGPPPLPPFPNCGPDPTPDTIDCIIPYC